MNQKLEERKPVVITTVGVHYKSNYVNYSDTDSQSDYFNGYSLGTKATAEWLKEDGDDVVTGYFADRSEIAKYTKRVTRIAKEAGYTVEFKEEKKHNEFNGIRNEWTDYTFKMTRKDDNPRFQESLERSRQNVAELTERMLNLAPSETERRFHISVSIQNAQKDIARRELNQ